MLFFIELLYFEMLKKTFFEKIGHIVLLVISVLGMTLIRYNGKYVVISLVLYYLGVFLYRKGKKEYGHLLKVCILMVVTLCISSVGLLILNSLLVLPGAAARNVAKNMKQYHILSVLFALVAGIGGLIASYYLGSSTGAAISLLLALIFTVSFCFRKGRR